eukprot:1661756-Pleurochrysis_carterae.AAC.1
MNAEWRRALPRDYLSFTGAVYSDRTNDSRRVAFEATVARMLGALVSNVPLDAACDQFACARQHKRTCRKAQRARARRPNAHVPEGPTRTCSRVHTLIPMHAHAHAHRYASVGISALRARARAAACRQAHLARILTPFCAFVLHTARIPRAFAVR